MLRTLLVGIPVMMICLLLQAVFVAACLRSYVRIKDSRSIRPSMAQDVLLMSLVMLLMTLGNFFQTAIWALLFLMLGEFRDFPTALYFSGVNFATLGYGDIVMSQRWRLLGPLEAANGILMFGVSTSVMTAAVIDFMKHSRFVPRGGDRSRDN